MPNRRIRRRAPRRTPTSIGAATLAATGGKTTESNNRADAPQRRVSWLANALTDENARHPFEQFRNLREGRSDVRGLQMRVQSRLRSPVLVENEVPGSV